jgi:hypothetical protein
VFAQLREQRTNPKLTNQMKTTTKLTEKLQSAIEAMPTFAQRMAAEAILDLLIEGAISEREATRQLNVNGIEI